MKSIVLRICEKGSAPFLQLIDASTIEAAEPTVHAEEQLPADLKFPPDHSDDYATYREFFLNEENEHTKFTDIGRHLFDLLHIGDVGRKWNEFAKVGPLRVLLDIETSATGNRNIARLPWELIFDGRNRRFQKKKTPIVRIRNYQDQEAPNVEPINWPIRLLIVIGVNDPAIAAAEEVERIEDVLHKVNRLIDVEVIESPPDINELEETCKRFKPHIFHYIGHGGIDFDGNAFIRLRGSNDDDDPWLASDIENDLEDWEWIPRFAFINACRTSGGTTASAQIGAWGIADAFNSLRVPAVLTMQANIDGKLAGKFAGRLYEHLARGECIDLALVAARNKVRQNIHASVKDNKRDWATPTLTISLPAEKILPLAEKTSQDHKPEVKACVKFHEIDILANCKDERRKFLYGFYPIERSEPPNNLVLVHGSKTSGKTWVTLWCLEACALLDHNVRHVEVVSGETPKWLQVLRRIQRGDASKAVRDQLIYGPLNEAAFYEFNHDLHHRINYKTLPRWETETEFAFEENLDLTNLDNLPIDTVKNIFTSFRKALRQAAEPNNPLIIVLDQWSYEGARIAAGHMEYLIRYLFMPAAGGDLSSPDGRSVKLVLVMNDDELEKMYPELKNKLNGSFREVRLRGIRRDRFEKIAREFFRNVKTARWREIGDYARNINKKHQDFYIEFFGQEVTSDWQPELLGRMLYAIENFDKNRRTNLSVTKT